MQVEKGLVSSVRTASRVGVIQEGGTNGVTRRCNILVGNSKQQAAALAFPFPQSVKGRGISVCNEAEC